MTMVHREPSKAISVTLGILFVFLAGIIGYATFTQNKPGSFELRSKASSDETVIKEYLFNSTAEGWVGTDVDSFGVSNGLLEFTTKPTSSHTTVNHKCGSSTYANIKSRKGKLAADQECKTITNEVSYQPAIEIPNADVVMPPGQFRRFKMDLLAGSSTASAYTFRYAVSYQTSSQSAYTAPTVHEATADARFQQVAFDFPDSFIGNEVIKKLKISFNGLHTSTPVKIDSVGLYTHTQPLCESGDCLNVTPTPTWCGLAGEIPGITSWPDYEQQCL